MGLSESQARALAFLLNGVRPDWPIGSLMSLFEKHRDVDIGPLTVAAMTKALEPSCRTPAPIFTVGPHWPNPPANLPPPERCKTHTSYYAHNCGGCRADKLAAPEAAPTFKDHEC